MPITTVCQCGVEFTHYRSVKRKFCSPKCAYKWRNKSSWQIESWRFWEGLAPKIIELYHGQRLSQQGVAEILKVNQVVLGEWMIRLGIKRRGRGRRGIEHYYYKDGKSIRAYRKLVVKEKCDLCDSTKDLLIHHVNLDHYDDSEGNLQVLCKPCHSSLHKKLWWAAKKAGVPYKSNSPNNWGRKGKDDK